MPTILPLNIPGEYYTGALDPDLTVEAITSVLGFPPNIESHDKMVDHSWGFTINGFPCGIWDYRGTRWTTYDPDGVLHLVLGEFIL